MPELEMHDDPQLVADLHTSIRDVLRKESTTERIRDTMTGGDAWRPLWAMAVDLGWTGIGVPEQHGGLGLSLAAQVGVAEQLGHSVFPAPLLTSLIATAALSGPDAQSTAGEQLLEALAEGACVAVAAEPLRAAGAGELSARWVLDGSRSATVLAAWDGGLVAFPGPGERTALPGVDPSRPTVAMTTGTEDLQPLSGAGSRLEATARLLLAAELVGVGQRALDLAVAYAKDRRQFGKPIGEFQGVKHRLADIAVELIQARALVHAAAAPSAGLAASACAMAKAAAGDAAMNAVKGAIQVSGAVGTTAEHELPWLLRRARHGVQLFGDARALYAELGHDLVEALA